MLMSVRWLVLLLVLFAFTVRISEACACLDESCPIAGSQGTCCDGYLCTNQNLNYNSCQPNGSYNSGSCKLSPYDYGCTKTSDCCNPFAACDAKRFCTIACPDPTAAPTANPITAVPTTAKPTATPSTAVPTTAKPTITPTTALPSAEPSARPTTAKPSAKPTRASPSARPTAVPSTAVPTAKPTATPSRVPTASPTVLTKFLGFSTEVRADDVVLDATGGVDAAGIVAMQATLIKILNIAPRTYTSADGSESVVTGVFFISQYDPAAKAVVARTRTKELSTSAATTSTIKGTVSIVYEIIVAESQYSTTGSSLFDYLTSVLTAAALDGLLTTTVRGYADKYKSASLVSATVSAIYSSATFVEKDLDEPVTASSADNSGDAISTANLSILIVFLFLLVLVVVSVSVYYFFVVKGEESKPVVVSVDLEEQGTEVQIISEEVKSGKAGGEGVVVHEPVFVFRNAVDETGQEGGVLDLTEVSRVMRAKALVAEDSEQAAALMAFGTSGKNTTSALSSSRSPISPSSPPVNRHQKSFRLENVYGEVDDEFGFGAVPNGNYVVTSQGSGGHLETLDDRLHRIESLLGSDHPAAPSFKSNEARGIHVIQEDGSMDEDGSKDDEESPDNKVSRDGEDSAVQ